MAKLFVNSEDPDRTPCSAASDLGLHYLPITLLGVFRTQWVKRNVALGVWNIVCNVRKIVFNSVEYVLREINKLAVEKKTTKKLSFFFSPEKETSFTGKN